MIERQMPDVKVVGVDRGGVGTKHRKCFFHGRDQSIKNITLNYTAAYMQTRLRTNSPVTCQLAYVGEFAS